MQNFIFAFSLYPPFSPQVFMGLLLPVYISYINWVTLIQPCQFQIVFEAYPFTV